MTTDIEKFIRIAFTPPTGSNPADIREKILHWVEVANHPELHTTEQTPAVARELRRKGKQNARRLALRHPEIAAQITRELEAGQ
jgi:hypothetical protein